MITLEQAKNLKYGEILIDERGKRWRVSGQIKTWKTDAERIRVPLKHGLSSYDALETEDFFPDGKCEMVTRETDYEG